MRSELFRNVLTKRYALTDAFDGELLDDVHDEYTSFYRAVSSWLKFVFQFKFQSVLGGDLLCARGRRRAALSAGGACSAG